MTHQVLTHFLGTTALIRRFIAGLTHGQSASICGISIEEIRGQTLSRFVRCDTGFELGKVFEFSK